MKTRLRMFLGGFLGTLLLCAGLNVLAAHLNSDCGIQAILGWAHCADDISRAGFPWQFWEEGGLAYHSAFYPETLLADVGLAIVAGLGLGWAAQHYYGRLHDTPV
ncbi:MAG: hypothetical protein U0401_33560 [Anaerolineae bacterium]